jgi:hypothetical protein
MTLRLVDRGVLVISGAIVKIVFSLEAVLHCCIRNRCLRQKCYQWFEYLTSRISVLQGWAYATHGRLRCMTRAYIWYQGKP